MKKKQKYEKLHREEKELVEKRSCICGGGGCGSSDAFQVYYHPVEDEYSGHCFACKGNVTFYDYDNHAEFKTRPVKDNTVDDGWNEDEDVDADIEAEAEDEFGGIENGIFDGIEDDGLRNLPPVTVTKQASKVNTMSNVKTVSWIKSNLKAETNYERKVHANSYEFFGVVSEKNEKGKIIGTYYPVYKGGKHTGYKSRTLNEDGKLKNFAGAAIGDRQGSIQLFGQWNCNPDGKSADWQKVLVITEGEEDAIALYESLRNAKYRPDIVSLPNGASKKAIQDNKYFLDKYAKIVLAFDNDEAGERVAEEAIDIINSGTCFSLKLPKEFKDISEFWVNNRVGKDAASSIAESNKKGIEMEKLIKNAQKSMRSNLIDLVHSEGTYKDRHDDIIVPFPECMGTLNQMLGGGFALGEIVNIGAASSTGKSTFIKEIINTILMNTNLKVGIFSIEETAQDFMEGLVGIHCSKMFAAMRHKDRDFDDEFMKLKSLLLSTVETEVDEKGNEVQVWKPWTPADSREVLEGRVLFHNQQGRSSATEILNSAKEMACAHGVKVIILDPVQQAIGADTEVGDFCGEIINLVKAHNVAWFNIHHVRKSGNGAKANSAGADLNEEDFKGSGAWFQTGMINAMLIRDKTCNIRELSSTTRIKLVKSRRIGTTTGDAGTIKYNSETGRLQTGMSTKMYKEVMEVYNRQGQESAENYLADNAEFLNQGNSSPVLATQHFDNVTQKMFDEVGVEGVEGKEGKATGDTEEKAVGVVGSKGDDVFEDVFGF